MGSMDGKVALVTGAGQGIGQGIAYALAAEGAAVAVAGRTSAKVEATAAEIVRRGGTALAVECDVTDAAQIEAAIDRTVAQLGSLDVLVNNAQEFNFGTVRDIPMELVEAGWRSGPLATLLFMRGAHEHLAGAGVVVNVSSAAASEADVAGIALYGAAKNAIESISRAAAVEWAPDGIRVNTIVPFARTPAVQAVLDQVPDLEGRLLEKVPLGRIGDPEADIGPAVAFLCSPAAGYITGTTLTIDGGSVRVR